MNYPVQDDRDHGLLLAAIPEKHPKVDLQTGSDRLPLQEIRSCGDFRHFSGLMSVFGQEWMKRHPEGNTKGYRHD